MFASWRLLLRGVDGVALGDKHGVVDGVNLGVKDCDLNLRVIPIGVWGSSGLVLLKLPSENILESF